MATEVIVPVVSTLHGYDGETWIENKPPSIYGDAWNERPQYSPNISDELSYRTVSPIVGIKDQTKKRFIRPKSVPPSLRPQSQVTGHRPRPKTAAVHSIRECDRIGQVERESTRKHNFEIHLPSRKQRSPPWQKQLETPTVPVMVTPNYVLSKSKSKIEMTINTDEFFEPQTSPMTHMRREDPERDSLISQLQAQIDDLTLFLEEERLNHRESKRKASDQLHDKLEELNHRHENYVRQLQDKYEEDQAVLKMEYEDLITKNTEESNIATTKLKKDIEYLQGAFESYKSNLHFETDERWKKKEDELRTSYEEEFNEKVGKIKQQWLLEKNAERNLIDREHKNEMLTLKREHKREQDTLLRKYSDHQGDLDKLKLASEELKYAQEKLTALQESYDRVCSQLTDITRDLTDTKVKLYGYEQHFQDKVQEIDDKYQSQMNELKQANIELRRLYVRKCGQLFDEKAISEHAIQEQMGSAKETMKHIIKTRNRALVSVAACDPQLEKHYGLQSKHRPMSAPSTKIESDTARLSAGQTYQYEKENEDKRPKTAKPRIFHQIQQEINDGSLIVEETPLPENIEDILIGAL